MANTTYGRDRDSQRISPSQLWDRGDWSKQTAQVRDGGRMVKDNEKVKASKNEFAEALYLWLSKFLNKDALEKSAEELGSKIRSEEDRGKILGVLAPLNMWLTVYTCKRVFEDEKKRNDCLALFHHLVYTRSTEAAEEDFGKWMNYMNEKYIEYDHAMKTEHPSTPLWPVATLVNKELFGEIKKDSLIQIGIITHIGSFVKHLENAVRQYDVE